MRSFIISLLLHTSLALRIDFCSTKGFVPQEEAGGGENCLRIATSSPADGLASGEAAQHLENSEIRNVV
jgi:hypothetical protein